MKVGRCGIAAEVPDLAKFVAEKTESLMPAAAFYVEIVGDDRPVACLVFYTPIGGLIHFGAALHEGAWNSNGLMDYIWLRGLILWTAFVGLGFNHLQAIIRPDNKKVIRMLEMSNFRQTGRFVYLGRECLQYTLGDCVCGA